MPWNANFWDGEWFDFIFEMSIVPVSLYLFIFMWFSETRTEAILDNITLHFLHIDCIDEEILNLIENSIVSICRWPFFWEGDRMIIMNELIQKITSKKWTDLELGLISEFFIHLYLNYKGFKQKCLYFNIEDEWWIKKWFDGLYSLGEEGWLMESKSWSFTSQTISHKNKIKEAYKDLNDKVSGHNLNSQWMPINPRNNALYHAMLVDSSNDTLFQKIKKMTENFSNQEFSDIKKFNIIPCSTIFFDWKNEVKEGIENYEVVINEIREWISDKEIKKWQIICFSQTTIDLLLNYLIDSNGAAE